MSYVITPIRLSQGSRAMSIQALVTLNVTMRLRAIVAPKTFIGGTVINVSHSDPMLHPDGDEGCKRDATPADDNNPSLILHYQRGPGIEGAPFDHYYALNSGVSDHSPAGPYNIPWDYLFVIPMHFGHDDPNETGLVTLTLSLDNINYFQWQGDADGVPIMMEELSTNPGLRARLDYVSHTPAP